MITVEKWLNIKISSEAGIDVVCFSLVASEAESLQVTDIICTTVKKRDDVIDS